MTEGHFGSSVLPLLPNGAVFVCDSSETSLSQCRSLSYDIADNHECIREHAGVICQRQSQV